VLHKIKNLGIYVNNSNLISKRQHSHLQTIIEYALGITIPATIGWFVGQGIGERIVEQLIASEPISQPIRHYMDPIDLANPNLMLVMLDAALVGMACYCFVLKNSFFGVLGGAAAGALATKIGRYRLAKKEKARGLYRISPSFSP